MGPANTKDRLSHSWYRPSCGFVHYQSDHFVTNCHVIITIYLLVMFIHSLSLLLSCAGNDIEEDDYILPDGRDVSELKDRDAVWGNAWHIPDPEDPQARHVLHFLTL